MRPIVEVPQPIIWWTVAAATIFLFSVLFLLLTLRTRAVVRKARLLFWSLMIVGSLALTCFGGAVWRHEATRQPTPAEVQKWVEEARVKLKANDEALQAAVEKARRVNQEAIAEMEAERRANRRTDK